MKKESRLSGTLFTTKLPFLVLYIVLFLKLDSIHDIREETDLLHCIDTVGDLVVPSYKFILPIGDVLEVYEELV